MTLLTLKPKRSVLAVQARMMMLAVYGTSVVYVTLLHMQQQPGHKVWYATDAFSQFWESLGSLQAARLGMVSLGFLFDSTT